MSGVFNDVFNGGTGVMDNPSPIDSDSDPSNKGGIRGKTEQEELSNVQDRVNEYIQDNNLGKQLDTSLTGEGLLVTIRDNVLFESPGELLKVRGNDSKNCSK